MKDPTESVKEVEKSMQKLKDKVTQLQIVIDEVALTRVPQPEKKTPIKKKGKKSTKPVKAVKGKPSKGAKKPAKKAGAKKRKK